MFECVLSSILPGFDPHSLTVLILNFLECRLSDVIKRPPPKLNYIPNSAFSSIVLVSRLYHTFGTVSVPCLTLSVSSNTDLFRDNARWKFYMLFRIPQCSYCNSVAIQWGKGCKCLLSYVPDRSPYNRLLP